MRVLTDGLTQIYFSKTIYFGLLSRKGRKVKEGKNYSKIESGTIL